MRKLIFGFALAMFIIGIDTTRTLAQNPAELKISIIIYGLGEFSECALVKNEIVEILGEAEVEVVFDPESYNEDYAFILTFTKARNLGDPKAIGWTNIEKGVIDNHGYISMSKISEMFALSKNEVIRKSQHNTRVLAQAYGRAGVHEIFHWLLQMKDHEKKGLMQLENKAERFYYDRHSNIADFIVTQTMKDRIREHITIQNRQAVLSQ